MKFNHLPVDFGYDDIHADTLKKGRFYSAPNGKKYPSITTVMKHLSESSLAEWRSRVGDEEANKIGARAASRGTLIHDLMEKYVKGEDISTKEMMPHNRRSFINMTNIIDEHLTDVYAQEVALYSDFLGIAGRADLIGKWDGVTSIIDFKTSLRVKQKAWISNYFMQGSGYSIMFEERTGISAPNIVILMDVDNNSPIVFKEHRDNWDKQLIETISEYHRLQKCKPL